jgi:hypothetical protein
VITVRQFFETLRHPGGYRPTLLMSDGESMCWTCAKNECCRIGRATRDGLDDGWAAQAWFVHWEGEDDYCCNCNDPIPSEYGIPE